MVIGMSLGASNQLAAGRQTRNTPGDVSTSSAKLTAFNWHAGLVESARSRRGWRQRHEVVASCLLLGKAPRWLFYLFYPAGLLRGLLQQHEQYAPWLADRFDEA